MGDVEPAEPRAAVRDPPVDGPLTARELGTPSSNAASAGTPRLAGSAARMYLLLVQLPPRGVWGAGGHSEVRDDQVVDGAMRSRPSIARGSSTLLPLGAFGPATVRDMQNWSGRTRLKAAFEDLRPRLVTFRDDQGRGLLRPARRATPGPQHPGARAVPGRVRQRPAGTRRLAADYSGGLPRRAMLAPGRLWATAWSTGAAGGVVDRNAKASALPRSAFARFASCHGSERDEGRGSRPGG